MDNVELVMTVEQVARICHEANRAYCVTQGDMSQVGWNDAPQWQKDSAMQGVRYLLANPDAAVDSLHAKWMSDKLAEGWKYGEVKDPEAKTHPCMVPFEELPEARQYKDELFWNVVDAFFSTIEDN